MITLEEAVQTVLDAARNTGHNEEADVVEDFFVNVIFDGTEEETHA